MLLHLLSFHWKGVKSCKVNIGFQIYLQGLQTELPAYHFQADVGFFLTLALFQIIFLQNGI